MRVTIPLQKESYRWLFKQIWLRKGVMKEPNLQLPRYLVDKNVEIVDPRPTPATHPSWEPPVKDDPRFMPPSRIQDLPDYHEDYVYEFTTKSRLLEGEKQMLILTKTQPFYELPESVQQLIGAVDIPGQDELIQRYIMQASVWDPTKKKLPRRFNTMIPGWRFKAEWGIPRHRIISTLTQNLLRLCQTLGGRYPDLLQGRRFAPKPYVAASYNFQGDKPIWMRGEGEWLMSANRPLPPFASEELMDASVTHSLPDMFPVAPTIDLKHQHVWRDDNITGWRDGFTHPHPHTLYLNTDDFWSTSQRNAKALAFCFAHALANAKSKYGRDVKTLPVPVSTQCVMTDGESFNFVCFQLNTLNYDNAEGVKNLVWFDNNNEMYKKILPRRAMLRNTKYEDYDPEVFKKMLALYVNGARL